MLKKTQRQKVIDRSMAKTGNRSKNEGRFVSRQSLIDIISVIITHNGQNVKFWLTTVFFVL